MNTAGEPTQDPLIGRTLGGKFRVERLMARGGMGAVYVAIQAPFERRCALKVLRPRVEEDERYEFQRRFLLEASTVARLTHPNTVTVFDYGRTEDGVLFLAMEFLEGRSLATALRIDGAFPQERALEITRGVARSLREAHSLGVVHRDIKPANVFLTRHDDNDDFVKVIDFGLVKDVAGGEDDQTQAGIFMGSPKYMAPEQIQGATVDARTDVYALGVVLFEMLAGQVPFDKGSSMNTLMAHVNEAPPSVRQLNPASDVTPSVEQIIARALAKNPDDRFASMGDLLTAIKEATGSPLAMTSSEHWPASTSGAHVLLDRTAGASSESLRPVAPQTPPRSRWWLAAPVAAAALIGVGVWSQRRPAPPAVPAAQAVPSVVAQKSAPVAIDPAPSAPVLSIPEVIPERVLSLVSEPAGARVLRGENGPELCAHTPCSITLRGDDAKEGATLSLHLSRSGYVSRSFSLAVGGEVPSLKLNAVARTQKENTGTPSVYRKDPYENPPY